MLALCLAKFLSALSHLPHIDRKENIFFQSNKEVASASSTRVQLWQTATVITHRLRCYSCGMSWSSKRNWAAWLWIITCNTCLAAAAAIPTTETSIVIVASQKRQQLPIETAEVVRNVFMAFNNVLLQFSVNVMAVMSAVDPLRFGSWCPIQLKAALRMT